ncbi:MULTISPECIES: CesT family type III secretion system chaperone [Edwardsiella]|uniref:Tir chaperone n=2 Tax=Edwardsiella anguillarum TaxID=1821960 RepID=A0A076LQB1_9GAMM|nr:MULTISPECIES: CesT family type III secretion system chaperone [Edwardsiella]AJK93271.1 CesT [Edwardsiella sp. EA181011]GAJ68518.1 Tir chaperone [Edwardsiella piscicida]AIJ07804.1 Tir chaperone [Edwardsiella anguillarum ET080813]AKM46750.1 Tir chaperone [Edwardsiella sp. EA181011]AKR78928.1 CesT family type III secretion system chaperone [Edwardsiella sp. LADL05-105]
MSSRAQVLLESLSKRVGIDGLCFNEYKLCSFFIDDLYCVSLSDASDEHMMIYGVCGKFPINEQGFALEILNANLWFAESGGPHLCYESGSESLLLALRVNLDHCTTDKLENEIEHVVNAMENLYLVFHNQGIELKNDLLNVSPFEKMEIKNYFSAR